MSQPYHMKQWKRTKKEQKSHAPKRTGAPALFRNEFAWTKMGSVAIFDWPPPVGFSHCNGNITGDGFSCGEWDDERMAKVSFGALQGLLEERFPNFLSQNNPLHLTGEI